MTHDKKRIIELINILNSAAKKYYVDGDEIISNLEYDKLYDELLLLEEKTNITMGNSPTQNVGYEVMTDLPKERHQSKMLSLDKTKDRDELKSWLGPKDGLLSWKLDGLTVVLTYEEGKLIKAVTRGNGEIGEVITSNARVFKNVPVIIPYKGNLTLRGEAVIKYSDFEKINELIDNVDMKYKNPRNLCSGSVRQLNSKITAERNVNFYAFSVGDAGVGFNNSRAEAMRWLKAQGFDVVEFFNVSEENLESTIEKLSIEISDLDIPSDGLVLTYDDIEYSKSLGSTSKFPRDSIAFKWKDQVAETILKEIEWSPSRTGLLNPIAIFKPVELEGTTVKRASVHNLSILEELKLGLGDTIKVYKANMIIPQISENLTQSNNIEIPKNCPVCGSETKISSDSSTKLLMCPNPKCAAKQTKLFTLFVSRDALNIEGLSEATILKLMGKGFIHRREDIFKLEVHKDVIKEMEGFGEKSVTNLLRSIEKAKDTTPERLLYSLGIPGIGVTNAKLISRHCKNSWIDMIDLSIEELLSIDGIGDVMANDYYDYFKANDVSELVGLLNINETYDDVSDVLSDKVFVITGSLEKFENRKQLKDAIEVLGGKVTGAVTSKTDYLINNDIKSNSGKNKKAKDLEVEIITEDQAISLMKNEQ